MMYKSYIIKSVIEYGDVIMLNVDEEQIQGITTVHKPAEMNNCVLLGELGPVSISDKTSYRKISWI